MASRIPLSALVELYCAMTFHSFIEINAHDKLHQLNEELQITGVHRDFGVITVRQGLYHAEMLGGDDECLNDKHELFDPGEVYIDPSLGKNEKAEKLILARCEYDERHSNAAFAFARKKAMKMGIAVTTINYSVLDRNPV